MDSKNGEDANGGPISDRDYGTLAAFRHALRRFERFSEDAARETGLTPAQHQLLLAVKGHSADWAPMADIAEMLQLKLHSVGELVARAHRRGLVARRSDPADHRRVLLRLTDLGLGRLEALSVLHREELRRFRTDMNVLLSELDEHPEQQSA